ncbi:aminoglycoside phosphotransferase family protein [Pedococcus sp. KACC 23699]|uniref:Aminoglycoside phosphotransferase family protein n=1 Tax=Pedococcus sp. KACC 23699 TaxID=3149228 RepID=A0AAU7JRJ7_9MICO
MSDSMAIRPPAHGDGEVLSGGNTGLVVRVDDTVRRQVGHWTPAVHALLDHLEEVGFDAAPRALHTDEQGREVLSFIEGIVGTLGPHPVPPAFQTVGACRAIGAWIRAFHDAQEGFVPDPDLPWRLVPGREPAPGEVVVHHDVGTYNTVLRDDGSFAVIDFDFAAPGDPVEDLAYALWAWTPLWDDREAARREFGSDDLEVARSRFAALLDGYGVDDDQRSRTPAAVLTCMTDHADALEVLADRDPAFAALVEQGTPTRVRRDAAWFRAHQDWFAGS